MFTGERPGLRGLECEAMGEIQEQSSKTLLTLKALGENLIIANWCPKGRGNNWHVARAEV